MVGRLVLVVATLAVPALVAAQDVPNAHASDTAKAMVAAHSATHFRGEAVGLDHRPVTPATPAGPATRATPATPASPAKPATPAVPASPSKKPTNPGQSGSHRP